MTPETRTPWALGISLLIWMPVAAGILSGRIDLPIGGLYYLGALAFGWVGTGIIVNITEGYRRTAESLARAKRQIEDLEEESRLAEQQEREEQRRRATDHAQEPPDDV